MRNQILNIVFLNLIVLSLASAQANPDVRNLFFSGPEYAQFLSRGKSDPRALYAISDIASGAIFQAAATPEEKVSLPTQNWLSPQLSKEFTSAKDKGAAFKMALQSIHDTYASRGSYTPDYSSVTFRAGNGVVAKERYLQVLLTYRSKEEGKEYRFVLESSAHNEKNNLADNVEDAARALQVFDLKVIQFREVNTNEEWNPLEKTVDEAKIDKLLLI